MLTDPVPRKSRSEYLKSDQVTTLDLPSNRSLQEVTAKIESAMKLGRMTEVRRHCEEFLAVASQFYEVPRCGIRVLAARPLRVRENWTTELFGDYTPQTMIVRVWIRTAVRREITSFGTFLSTLTHEFCHHLDFQRCKRFSGILRQRSPAKFICIRSRQMLGKRSKKLRKCLIDPS